MVIAALAMASGCSPKIIEKVKTEYKYVTDYQHDTLWRDKVVTIREKGDTVRITETEYLYKTMWKEKHDTLIVRDSIPVPYPEYKEVPVEKPLSWWQKFRLRSFWWLVLSVAGLAGWIFRKPLMALIGV